MAQLNPNGSIIKTLELESILEAHGCIKIGPCTERICIWRTPNGRHFSAPNPQKMWLVPTLAQERLLAMIEGLSQ